MNIIFDLDGTLWNPSNTILNAWSNVLSNQNINVNLEDIKNLLGLSNKDIINWFVCNKKISEDKATIILNECQEMEISFILHDGWDLFDGVKETLKRLSVANNLYIVSNCQAGYIEAFLEFYKLDKYFKDYECSGNTNKDKEYNINLIIKRNDLKNSIYVGDTVGDFIASHSCGIPFIYANYGFGKSNEFDYKINGFSDLLKLCYNLKGRRRLKIKT